MFIDVIACWWEECGGIGPETGDRRQETGDRRCRTQETSAQKTSVREEKVVGGDKV
jgi:hypothetical protein